MISGVGVVKRFALIRNEELARVCKCLERLTVGGRTEMAEMVLSCKKENGGHLVEATLRLQTPKKMEKGDVFVKMG